MVQNQCDDRDESPPWRKDPRRNALPRFEKEGFRDRRGETVLC
jgi:hypothetical protein